MQFHPSQVDIGRWELSTGDPAGVRGGTTAVQTIDRRPRWGPGRHNSRTGYRQETPLGSGAAQQISDMILQRLKPPPSVQQFSLISTPTPDITCIQRLAGFVKPAYEKVSYKVIRRTLTGPEGQQPNARPARAPMGRGVGGAFLHQAPCWSRRLFALDRRA